MIEFSTVAGTSVSASAPCPRACGVDLGDTENLLDLIGKLGWFAQVDGLAAETPRLGETVGLQVSYDHDHPAPGWL
jgi:hypothetical protein